MLKAIYSHSNSYLYVLDESQTFQEVFGFGGAFTDAAGINIHKMEDEDIVMSIIKSYYDPKGLDYSIGRLNMGGCDFSTRRYTYADTEGDINLDSFALQEEDLEHKVNNIIIIINVLIPYITDNKM